MLSRHSLDGKTQKQLRFFRRKEKTLSILHPFNAY